MSLEGEPMQMSDAEKAFVNAPRHARRVAARAETLVAALGVPRGARLLEVGCGEGAAARVLVERLGLDVTAVDVDPDQVRLATSRSGPGPVPRFEVADATRLPFPDAAFDVVLSQRVTHHVPDWSRALEEMIRVLRPGGGLAYVDFLLPPRLASALRVVTGRDRLPTRAGLERIVRAHRLDPLRSSGWLSRTLLLRRPAA